LFSRNRLTRTPEDVELFTFHVRAKSGLINELKGIRKKNVNVLDLERILMSRKFSFGYSHFMDYFHFNDAGHKLVARCLYEMIMNEDDIKGFLYGNRDDSTDLTIRTFPGYYPQQHTQHMNGQ
jgi:hypothetical protein